MAGCIGNKPPQKNIEWLLPAEPEIKEVEFIKTQKGRYLNNQEGKKLADNIDEYKAYIQKMELLIDEMLKHYDAKSKVEGE
jgi:hypothetical protein